MKLFLDDIEAFVFDFDGVLTDNNVLVDENGKESVKCSRADGLAFDVLNKLNKPVYIISTERNPVVEARAKKLNVPVLQGVKNKVETVVELTNLKGYSLDNILFTGNDLNDYNVMQLCGHTACPIDSHKRIKSIAQIVLNTKGGNGVVRELIEEIFMIFPDFCLIIEGTTALIQKNTPLMLMSIIRS